MTRHIWPPQVHQSNQTLHPWTVLLFAFLRTFLFKKLFLPPFPLILITIKFYRNVTNIIMQKGDESKQRRCIIEEYRRSRGGRNEVDIRDPRRRCNVLLGIFDTAKAVVQAYDMVEIEFCGVKAQTNFPIPVGNVNWSPNQISTIESSNVVTMATIEVEAQKGMWLNRHHRWI